MSKKNTRSEKDKIRDYIEFNKKPFCAADIIDELGLKKSSVYFWISHLEEHGVITVARKQDKTTFYVKERRPEVTRKRRLNLAKALSKSKAWKLLFAAMMLTPVLLQCSGGCLQCL